MGTQRLSAKSCRRIERDTGQEVEFACASGGYVFGFVTPDHRHGWYNKKTGEWGWDDADGGRVWHYSNGCGPWEGRPDEAVEHGAYRKSLSSV